MPSSTGSSAPRDQTHVSCGCCMAGGLFTAEPPGETQWKAGNAIERLGREIQETIKCRLLLLLSRFSHVRLFVTPWLATHQAPLSSAISRSLLKFMSIEEVMLSNHLTLCHPFLFLPSIFPSIGAFYNEFLFASGGQKIGASASTSVLPVNIKG